MTRPLQAAVIGLGVGAEHARAYAATPRCAVRWLCDLDHARAERLAAEIGRGARAAEFKTILADPGVDVVSIATYDDAHAVQTVAALRARKHVFVEKPLCRSMAELEEIAAAWEAAGCPQLASNLPLRAAPLYRWLREAVRAGALGTIYAFDGDYLYGRVEKLTAGWRGETKDYSVMLGGAVHLVDLMLWLTGQRPQAVRATGNRIATAGSAFPHDDYVAATYHFASGLVGRVTANFGCVHRHQHVVRVFGTRATFVHDDQGARLHESRDPARGPVALDLPPRPPAKGALIPPLVEAIAEGDDGRARTRHDFDVISACLAADRARSGGEGEEIDYV
jgi:predicted dehydrogenase